ncbi:MAG: KamA family radical SAM protein [bacterium]
MFYKDLPPYLKELVQTCPSIGAQFIPSNREESDDETVTCSDPLMEEESTVTRGLVHKYGNRALVLLTMNCRAYCRFCTRRRKVSDIERGLITEEDLERMIAYLKVHTEIRELVISGGDPLTVPAILRKALQAFSKMDQIKIIRIGSRLPAIDPLAINEEIISTLMLVKKQPLYLMLHFEHPSELTPELLESVKKLRQATTMIFSQSVFLKGVNDNFETLYKLFSGLLEIGVKPYYLYRCDYVKGAGHFIVPLEKEIKIMTELRRRLSGLACPMYVIDTPNGSGKVPVPLDFWDFDKTKFRDFQGEEIEIVEPN